MILNLPEKGSAYPRTPCVRASNFIEIPVLNGNSADPDQTLRCVAYELGLHCLQMSFLWDARRKWVKGLSTIVVDNIFSKK